MLGSSHFADNMLHISRTVFIVNQYSKNEKLFEQLHIGRIRVLLNYNEFLCSCSEFLFRTAYAFIPALFFAHELTFFFSFRNLVISLYSSCYQFAVTRCYQAPKFSCGVRCSAFWEVSPWNARAAWVCYFRTPNTARGGTTYLLSLHKKQNSLWNSHAYIFYFVPPRWIDIFWRSALRFGLQNPFFLVRTNPRWLACPYIFKPLQSLSWSPFLSVPGGREFILLALCRQYLSPIFPCAQACVHHPPFFYVPSFLSNERIFARWLWFWFISGLVHFLRGKFSRAFLIYDGTMNLGNHFFLNIFV